MFWIGLIVGIIIGMVALKALSRWYCRKVLFASYEECDEVINTVITAARNRKSYLQAFTDEEILSTVTLEETE